MSAVVQRPGERATDQLLDARGRLDVAQNDRRRQGHDLSRRDEGSRRDGNESRRRQSVDAVALQLGNVPDFREGGGDVVPQRMRMVGFPTTVGEGAGQDQGFLGLLERPSPSVGLNGNRQRGIGRLDSHLSQSVSLGPCKHDAFGPQRGLP